MRVWAEISLKNIRHNFNEIQRVAGDSQIMAVVKANAYGHGVEKIAPLLESLGADRFAVATIDEACELRSIRITRPIMVLGRTEPEDFGLLFEHNVIQTVFDLTTAELLSESAENCGKTLKIHIKVDTGMSRLGFLSENADVADEIEKITQLPGLEAEGIFTHFATSEALGDEFLAEQIARFTRVLDELECRNIRFPIIHAANSGAILNLPKAVARFNMVRPGIILFGVYPGNGLEDKIGLHPVMRLCAKLVQVQEHSAPISVSYGRTFKSEKAMRTGTVSIGYADGLHRSLSNKLEVLIRGKRARQIGNICMDMMVVDLTDIPEATAGDTVTIFGKAPCEGCYKDEKFISVCEVAEKEGTIPYEILCAQGARLSRTYPE